MEISSVGLFVFKEKEETMKLVKMKISRGRIEGRTRYTYPTPYYDAFKVVFGPIYEGGMESGAVKARARKNDDEYIIVGVKDADLSQFLQANGLIRDGFIYSAVEINQLEAVDFGEEFTGVTEKITDRDEVLRILAKTVRKEELTVEELDAINPESPVKGINKSKSFKSSLVEAMEQNA